MTDTPEMKSKLFKALRSDRTLMLGLAGADEGHSQPMTAQFDGDDDRGPIWFFTSTDSDLVAAIRGRARGVANFADKGHDLFAAMEGDLVLDNDRAVIDRLWNRYVAAWFEGGKDDPKLQLIRFEPETAQVWLNESSLLAGIKLMLGSDPKQDYADKVGEVRLN